ncbi:MAG TPA: hypothetical protein VFU23_00270, partial [Gemmatimonadales bacterium]|nr:hypothetical protein [Gemmatimonadales bacterium]
WLLLLLPLVVLLYALWSGTHAMGKAGGGEGGIGDLFSFGVGFYLSLASGLVLAAGGVKRYLASA